MGGRIIRMFVVIAMLFGSMMSPAIVHAAGPDVAHLFESAHVDLDHDHHVVPNDHDGDGSSRGGSGNVPPHHHCTAGLALIVPEAMLEIMPDPVSMFRPLLAAELASWQSTPPTQPPSA